MSERACRYCGCTENRACAFDDPMDPGLGFELVCGWIEPDVCSNPVCVAALGGLEVQVADRLPAMMAPEQRLKDAQAIVRHIARCVGGHFAADEIERQVAS
jgi:hypothetical protein